MESRPLDYLYGESNFKFLNSMKNDRESIILTSIYLDPTNVVGSRIDHARSVMKAQTYTVVSLFIMA